MALYHTAVELENLRRTENREQRTENRQRIQLQRPLLSPVDCQGERANMSFIKMLLFQKDPYSFVINIYKWSRLTSRSYFRCYKDTKIFHRRTEKDNP